MPDRVIVLIAHGIIRIFPIHPIAETLALFGLNTRKLDHAVFTGLHELFNTECFDIGFGLETVFLFHFHFDPETLAIETILVTHLFAQHAVIAVEDVF